MITKKPEMTVRFYRRSEHASRGGFSSVMGHTHPSSYEMMVMLVVVTKVVCGGSVLGPSTSFICLNRGSTWKEWEKEGPVARVLPLACANEHLLRRMDSLVAVQ